MNKMEEGYRARGAGEALPTGRLSEGIYVIRIDGFM